MADTSPERVIHQAIHGYRHGHQLLAASADLDHETANVLGHNSDSAPRSRASDGSYLTGYPLPDDRYVVARTWADSDAERPNTVVTRSLILPRAHPTGFGGTQILSELRPPSRAEREAERLEPLNVNQVTGESLGLTSEEAIVASDFYWTADRLAHGSDEARARIAIGLWQQMWMPARHDLHFCTAPDTTRFTRHERPLLFTSEPTDAQPADKRRSAFQLVARDLEQPGPFREFLHFVASGEKAIGLIEPFAEAYELLNEPGAPVEAFAALLDRYHASEPRRLRRLKRRFLSFQGPTPRWDVNRFDLLRALTHHGLGHAIYASDASLDRWLRYCWDSDSQQTALLLPDAPTNPDDLPAGPTTAAKGIAGAFASQASKLITSDTLAIARTLSPDAALAAVWDRNEPDLWQAWSNLDPEADVPSGSVSRDTYDWSVPLKAVRHHSRSLSRLLRHYPESLDSLIALADKAPATTDLDLDLTGDAKRYIRGRLKKPDPHLSGLSRLSDHGTLPRQLDIAGWRRLLARSQDEAVHGTAYLIARGASVDHWEVTVLAVATLHRILDGDGGSDAWRRLGPHVRGDRHTWDRCDRLLEDYADQVKRLDDTTKAKALTLLHKRNTAAARSLAAHLRPAKSKKKFSLFDPSTW